MVDGTLPKTATPLSAAFDNGVTLLGYAAPVHDLHPGDDLDITLYWRSARAPAARYTTFVQLSPQDPTQRVAENNRWLGGTLYPSDFWRAGDTIRQRHALHIPENTPAPGLYWIRLGLVDAQGTRIPLAGGDDSVSLGPWRVRDPAARAKPSYRVTYRLGEAITLRGYDIHLDDALTITLTWTAQAIPPQDYAIFVHALDATGNVIAQHDGPPAAGRYPTTWWLPRDTIRDPHVLPLPAEATQLRVGMYDPHTLVRLPVYDADGTRLPDDAIPLPLVRVKSEKWRIQIQNYKLQID